MKSIIAISICILLLFTKIPNVNGENTSNGLKKAQSLEEEKISQTQTIYYKRLLEDEQLKRYRNNVASALLGTTLLITFILFSFFYRKKQKQINQQLLKQNDQIQNQKNKIEEFNLYLEDIIQERTEDLIETNNKLEKQIEEKNNLIRALEASESRFKMLFENAPDAYFIIDQQGTFIDGNRIAEEVSGYDKNELIGKNLFHLNLLSNDIIPDIKKIFIDNQISLHNNPTSIQLKRKDGNIKFLEITTYPLYLQNKTIILGIARDISKRKKAERALQISEEKFSKAFISNPDPLYILNISKGTFVDVNPAFEMKTGYSKMEVIGKTPLDLNFYKIPEDREKLFLKLEKDGKLENYEVSFRIKSGEIRLCKIYSEIIKIDNEAHLISIVRDITDIIKAEKALKESEEKYRTLIENLPQGIFMKNKDQQYISFNKKFCDDLKINEDQITGKKDQELFSSKRAQQYEREDQEVIASGKTMEFVNIVEENGVEKHLQIVKSPFFDEDGKITGLLGFYWDVTERKHAENISRQISESIAGITGEQFFQKLVLSIGKSLKVDYAIVGEWNEEKPEEIQTIAVYSKGEIIANFIYDLKGTPCFDVVGKEMCFFPDKVQNLFPNDILLQTINASTYLGIPLFNTNGKANGILVIIDTKPLLNIDIAKLILQMFAAHTQGELERLKMVKDLKKSEEKFRTMIEASPNAVTTANMNAEITYASNKTAELYGFKREKELLGMNILDLIAKGDHQKAQKSIRQTLNDGIVKNMEFAFIRKNDSPFYGELSMAVLKDVKGKPEGFISITKDISERKQVQEAIKKERDKAQNYLDIAGVIIVALNKNGNVTLINKKGCDITGYTEAELNGQNWVKLLVPESSKKKVKTIFSQIINGKLDPFEYVESVIRRKDGKEKTIAWQNAIVKDEYGNIVGTLSSGLDITEQKTVEEEIKRYQQNLKALNSQLVLAEEKERRRIAVNLHDHISQSLAMAKIKIATSEKSKELTEIKNIVGEAKSFITDAIEKSRSLTYELSPPVLYELGLLEAIKWQIEKINKQYKTEIIFIEKGSFPELNKDKQILLFRSISELIINTIKHARANSITIDYVTKNDFLYIAVEDNGIGFDYAKITEKPGSVSGFGLFSIKERIEYFQGEFVVKSKINKGSRMIIGLPVND